jgi:epoxyqueuosine reductase
VKPLEPIVSFLNNEGYQAIVCKSGSILPLKLAAVRAGLGWQGKNSLLVTKKYGTFLAFGGIVTNANLEHNTKEESNRCRDCDKCQKACPLAALDQPYVLNVKKCMSYLLQIENLTKKMQIVMENRIGDCEICQEACPWNRKHLDNPLVTSMTESFQKKIEDWENFFYLPNLVELSEKGYRKMLGHLNTNIPYNIFRRNVLIARERVKKLERWLTNKSIAQKKAV